MISHLAGTVGAISPEGAVIEVGGVGLLVQCTPGTLATLRPGEQARVATSLVVREDALTLFGFTTDDERDVFVLLQTASGVGPRLALAMLAVFTPDALRRAVPARTSRRSSGSPASAAKVPNELSSNSPAAWAHRARGAQETPAPWRCPGPAGRPRGGSRSGRGWSTWAGRPATPTRPSRRWRPTWPLHVAAADGTGADGAGADGAAAAAQEPDAAAMLRAALRKLSRA